MLLDVLTDNKTVSLKYSELGILINTSRSKLSLFNSIINTFIRIDELAGLRKAINNYCVSDKKGFMRLDEHLSPDTEINLHQTDAFVHKSQEEFNKNKSLMNYLKPPC